MSTVDRPGARSTPALAAGQRLDRATFHQRYQAMPPGIRAELVGGVVFMPSPLGYRHGKLEWRLSSWLGHFERRTRGVDGLSNVTTQLGDYGEVQPDLILRIPEELGGASKIVGGFIVGPPELVVEVSQSTRSHDLGPKKADYQRAGVREYLFVGLDPEEVRWFVLREGVYRELEAGEGGELRSEAFPGLWLNPGALLSGDADALIATLERGLTSPEHEAFVARLSGGGHEHG